MSVASIKPEAFEREVITRSWEQPVLVDFWAPWCGPCRMLAPVLDALAEAFAKQLSIVKINVDEAAELAHRFEIRGVPNLKLFVDGRPVDERSGALPREQLRQWLTPWLTGPADQAIAQLRKQVEQGEREMEDALTEAEAVLQRHPDAILARKRLVDWLLACGACARAREHLPRLPRTLREDEDLRRRLHLCELRGAAEDLASLEERIREHPEDLEARLRLADALAAAERFEEALAAYLGVLEADRHFMEGAARKGMLRVFELLGNRGDLVDSYRKKLAQVLFS